MDPGTDRPAQAQGTPTKSLPLELRLDIYSCVFRNDTIDLGELYRKQHYGSALTNRQWMSPTTLAEYFKRVQLRVTKKPLLNGVPNLVESLAILGDSNVERVRNLQITLPGSLTVQIHMSNRAGSVIVDETEGMNYWTLLGKRHVITAKPNNPVLSDSVDQLVKQFLAKRSATLDEMLARRTDGLFLTNKQIVTLVDGMEVHLGFRTTDVLKL